MPSAGGGPGWLLAAPASSWGGRARARGHARPRLGRARAQDPGGALLRLGDPGAGRARGGPPEAAEGYARRAEENAEWLGPRAARRLAGRARAAMLLAAGEPLEAARVADESAEAAAPWERTSRPPSPRLAGRALAAAGERSGRSRRCARRRASSTRAARCACATRCAASCASSALAPRCAARPPATTPGWPRSRSASSRSRS